jgi:hypothetical protein
MPCAAFEHMQEALTPMNDHAHSDRLFWEFLTCIMLKTCYSLQLIRVVPDKDLLMAILLPSSRFHLTLGGGDPVAWHVSVTFALSLTITSELLRESSMFGGTETKRSRWWDASVSDHLELIRGLMPNFFNGFDHQQAQNDFSSSLCVQTLILY